MGSIATRAHPSRCVSLPASATMPPAPRMPSLTTMWRMARWSACPESRAASVPHRATSDERNRIKNRYPKAFVHFECFISLNTTQCSSENCTQIVHIIYTNGVQAYYQFLHPRYHLQGSRLPARRHIGEAIVR